VPSRRFHALAGSLALALLAFTIPAPAQAEPRRVALSDALAAAERESPDLRLAAQGVAAARARVVTAGARPNPILGLDREQLGGDERYHETAVTVARTIDLSGQRGARREAALREAAAAEMRVDAERARLRADVLRAYLRAAAAESRLGVLGEAAALFRDASRAGETRFREGDIARYELERLQVEAARYETLLSEARLEVRSAGRELALLAPPDAAAPDTLLLPADTLGAVALRAATLGADTAISLALRRADVRAAEADVEAARAVIDLRRRARRADPMVSVGLKEQAGGVYGAVVGVSVPLPVSDRGQGPIAEAEAALAEAETRVALARRAAGAEARRALDRRASLAERLTLREGLIARTRSLLRAAEVAYAEGETGLLELLDAAESYRAAREGADALLADYLTSVADLERATGGTDR